MPRLGSAPTNWRVAARVRRETPLKPRPPAVDVPVFHMLRQARHLENFELRARDGRIGHVTDLFFDDRQWTIRYFVVNTATWLEHRDVLIAPASVGAPDWSARVLPVDLTREQVRQSPPVDTTGSVSREHELALSRYYDWPAYWGATGFGDGFMLPLPPILPRAVFFPHAQEHAAVAALDPEHVIRSAEAVIGYHVEANDGGIGHVEDFLIDEATWEIRYLIVDTRNWWPGQRVLIPPALAYEVGWDDAKVYIDLPRAAIAASRKFDPSEPLEPEDAPRLHEHHAPPRRSAEP